MTDTHPHAAEPEIDRKRRHRRTLTLSTIVSMLAICGVVLPVAGAVSMPWFVNFVGDAVADEISAEVKKQIEPTNAGLRVMIESTIAEIEDDISALEFRRDNMPESWTAADAQQLTNKRRRLRSQNQALAAMLGVERRDESD